MTWARRIKIKESIATYAFLAIVLLCGRIILEQYPNVMAKTLIIISGSVILCSIVLSMIRVYKALAYEWVIVCFGMLRIIPGLVVLAVASIEVNDFVLWIATFVVSIYLLIILIEGVMHWRSYWNQRQSIGHVDHENNTVIVNWRMTEEIQEQIMSLEGATSQKIERTRVFNSFFNRFGVILIITVFFVVRGFLEHVAEDIGGMYSFTMALAAIVLGVIYTIRYQVWYAFALTFYQKETGKFYLSMPAQMENR